MAFDPHHIAAIRRKLNAGAALITPLRFARLFHDGDALWVHHDHAEMWRRLTKAIAIERGLVDQASWAADENRLWGLHHARVWLRRQRAEQRKTAA